MFPIEKRFGVRLDAPEFDFLGKLDFSFPALMPDEMFALITVETLCRLVESKLAS